MKQVWFERLLVLLLFIIQIIVVIVGSVNYNKMNAVIRRVDVPYQTVPGITLEQEIHTDLINAERAAKSFYLTRRGNYLSDYFTTVYDVAPKIDRLDTIVWSTSNQTALTDSLISYFQKQLSVLNTLIYLENNEQVTDELHSIAVTAEKIKIDSFLIPVTTAPATKESKSEKKNFLSRLFSKPEKESEHEGDSIREYRKVASIDKAQAKIKDEVQKVRVVQKDKLKQIKQQEFELTESGIKISQKIQSIIDEIERIEQRKIHTSNIEAGIVAADARAINLSFSITIVLLLLAGSVTIIRYFFINERQRNYLKLEKQKALQLADSKQNLMANISHEMRTPLNAIIGFADQLLDTKLSAEQLEQMNIIKQSSEHLVKVIHDILDNSRLEAGKLKLNPSNYSPRKSIEEVIAMLRIQAGLKQIRITESFTDDIPEVIFGDELRLKQSLINIIGNAVKYTSAGSIHVNVERKDEALRIQVKDTGSGIPQDKLASMFNRFEQASEKLSGSGAGLGLHITRQLMELQGGTIVLQSEAGKGTTVTLILPFREVEKSENSTIKATNHDTNNFSLQHLRVLIADDELFNRKLLQRLLRKYGNTPDEAENGREAWEKIQSTKYDVVLMDVRMPELTGIEVTELARQSDNAQIKDVVIIGLTAGLESEKTERCMKAGMNAMLPKPFTEPALIDTIRTTLNKKL